MKEKMYTIPINDAVNAETECPFCFIEKKIEEDMLDFVLGTSASYMERDVRGITDEKGFCKYHFQKMFEYGNALGNAWILKTHYLNKIDCLEKAFKVNGSGKKSTTSFFGKGKQSENPIHRFVEEEKASCFICEKQKEHYERYLDIFIIQYSKVPEFKTKILASKGFCLSHFGDLCQAADRKLKSEELGVFYCDMETLMTGNLKRTYEDISWFIEKFDYKNKDADWKNSKDAVQRGMQKLKGC